MTARSPSALLHEPLLRVEGLTKRYGRLTALAGASFSIREAEILGLVGPNGSGKTTLFECLAGVRPADAARSESPPGRSIRGRELHTCSTCRTRSLHGPQTVGWALDFAVGYFGGRAERRAEVVDRLGLGSLLTSAIGTLSKGERKRALLPSDC